MQPRMVETEDGRSIATSYLVLGDESEVEADELVRIRDRKVSPLVEAERFLRDLLADGPHRVKEIEDLAGDRDLSWRTVQRAKANLGVDSFRKDGVWWWLLDPDEDADEADDEDEDAPLL